MAKRGAGGLEDKAMNCDTSGSGFIAFGGWMRRRGVAGALDGDKVVRLLKGAVKANGVGLQKTAGRL